MKRLYLIRHAKSSWGNTKLKDINRPLNPRGNYDSMLIGKVISKRRIVPDLIYSSPAKRCKQTISNILKFIPYPENEIIYEDILYNLHEVEKLKDILPFIKFIKNFPNYYDDIFLVGHNDGLNFILQYLTGKKINIASGTVICIKLFIKNRKDIEPNIGKILFQDSPKDYKNFENKDVVLD